MDSRQMEHAIHKVFMDNNLLIRVDMGVIMSYVFNNVFVKKEYQKSES